MTDPVDALSDADTPWSVPDQFLAAFAVLDGLNVPLEAREYDCDPDWLDRWEALAPTDSVGVYDVGAFEERNLNALAIGLGLNHVDYEPESFPLLRYEPDSTAGFVSSDCLLFCPGIGDASDVRPLAETLATNVDELGLVDPDDVEVTVSTVAELAGLQPG